jgi:hypothetical protein
MPRRKSRPFSPQNRWRRSVSDPVLFCREFLEFDPHPGQERWLRGSTKEQNPSECVISNMIHALTTAY